MKKLLIVIGVAVISACNSTKKTTEIVVTDLKDSVITVASVKMDSLVEEVDEKMDEITQLGIIFKVIPSTISLKNTKDPIFILTNTTSNTMRTGDLYELSYLNENGKWEKMDLQLATLDMWYQLEKNQPYIRSLTFLLIEMKLKPGTYKIFKEVDIHELQPKKNSQETISTMFEVVE